MKNLKKTNLDKPRGGRGRIHNAKPIVDEELQLNIIDFTCSRLRL